MASNTTAPSDVVVCAYPLSGWYGGLPRILHYALLLFVVVGYRSKWLVKGAFGSTMILSSTAVIHAITMVASQGIKPQVLDIDMLAIQAILLNSLLLFGTVMAFSKSAKSGEAQPIIKIWGLWIMIGQLICFVAICFLGPTPAKHNLFFSYTPKSSEAFCAADDPNCSYSCTSGRRSVVRGEEEITIVGQDDIYNKPFERYQAIAFFGTLFGVWAAVVAIFYRRSDKQAATTGRLRNQDKEGQLITVGSSEGKVGPKNLVFALFKYSIIVGTFLLVPCIVLTECYLWSGSLPKKEEIYAVDQWGPYVAAGFALLGSLLNHAFNSQ